MPPPSIVSCALATVVVIGSTAKWARADVIDQLAPGEWLELADTHLRDVCPPSTPAYDWRSRCKSVTGAWSGAAFDTTRNRLVVWGGGHNDYKGNEVYTFDMTTLAWSRTWGPTPEAQIPSGGTFEALPDGNPGSRHTYSGLVYVPPPTDALVAMGGSLWQSGFFARGIWSFSFSAGAWTRKKDGPKESGFGDPSVFDPVTRHVFRRGNTRMLEYDPVTDTTIPRYAPNGGFWVDDVSAAIDPDGRTMVIVGDGRLDVYHLDTDVYEAKVALTPTIATAFGQGAVGIDFDPIAKRYVLWKGGKTVYTYVPGDAAMQRHDLGGDDPGAVTTSGGVFGRFRYVPARNVFVRVNGAAQNVFVLRMTPGAGVVTSPPTGPASPGGASASVDATGSAASPPSSAPSPAPPGEARAASDGGGCAAAPTRATRATGLASLLVGAMLLVTRLRRRAS